MKLYRTLGILLLSVLLRGGPAHADIDCDQVDDVLTTGVAASTFVSGSAFTITAWLKVHSTAISAGSCWGGSNITGDTGGYVALGRNDNFLFCGYAYDGASHYVESASAVGWSHVAVRLSGGTLTLYVNGVATHTTTSGNVVDLSNPIRACAGASAFSGDRVSEIAYYNVAVPAEEIEYIGKSRVRGVGRTAPRVYWQFDACAHGVSANTVAFADKSGNGQTITGDDGANNLGLTCRGAEFVSRRWGVH